MLLIVRVPVDRQVVHLHAEADLAEALEQSPAVFGGHLNDVEMPGRPDPRAHDGSLERREIFESLVIASCDVSAALHEAIGSLSRPEMSSWAQRFRLPDAAGLRDNLPETLRAGAQGIVAMLPRRLKGDTRWVASGAIAGALGCVTAAALLSPAAIAALPIWTAVGAAITAVVRATVSGDKADEAGHTADNAACCDAVRGAALFALLLELQGRDEAAITRILDEVIADADFDTPGDVQHGLDAMRHRLDLALAGERAS